jgi:metal-dependent amidase/aminoacylase/carboxypeptidase family protein
MAITSDRTNMLYIAIVVNGTATEITPMTATLKFLSRITNEVFESQMQRAAQKICERQHYFGGRAA